jgi:hypothetical protein
MDQNLASATSEEELEKGYHLICIGIPLFEWRRTPSPN